MHLDMHFFMYKHRRLISWIILITGLLTAPFMLLAQENAEEDSLAPLVAILADQDDPQFHLDILKGISEALKGRRSVKMPEGWPKVAEKLARSPSADVRNLVQSLSTQFGDTASMEAAMKSAADTTADPDTRRKALASLVETKPKDLPAFLHTLIGDAAVGGAALRALAAYDDSKTPAIILARYKNLPANDKLDALNTLAAREPYAIELLKALETNAIPRADVTAATARALAELKNERIDQWLAKNWGAVRSTAEDKLKDMATIRQAVASAKPGEADPSRGRAVYSKTCQQCHTLFGEGGKVGPDLTGSGRADLEYILTNVVDPSALVGKDYQMWIVRTKDKQVINGLIPREDEQSITIVTENDSINLPRSEIARMKQSDISMMPEGLMQGLPRQELIDLIAYLRHPSQVPFPPGFEPQIAPKSEPAK